MRPAEVREYCQLDEDESFDDPDIFELFIDAEETLEKYIRAYKRGVSADKVAKNWRSLVPLSVGIDTFPPL